MIIWIASYPKSGNTYLRSFIAAYYFSKKGKFVDFASTGNEIEVITKQTPFYGESGGQVGDQGYIFNSNCKIKINDTQKKNGRFICSLWKS